MQFRARIWNRSCSQLNLTHVPRITGPFPCVLHLYCNFAQIRQQAGTVVTDTPDLPSTDLSVVERVQPTLFQRSVLSNCHLGQLPEQEPWLVRRTRNNISYMIESILERIDVSARE